LSNAGRIGLYLQDSPAGLRSIDDIIITQTSLRM
jgi:hypothetical protein